jgi:hypothetical protein
MFLFCSACRAESIGILLVKIGWMGIKLFLGYNSWKFLGSSPKMKFWVFWCFAFVPLVELNRMIYNLWKLVERLKCYFESIFWWKLPGGSPRIKFWDFWCFTFAPLVELNRMVYYLWRSFTESTPLPTIRPHYGYHNARVLSSMVNFYRVYAKSLDLRIVVNYRASTF